MSDDASVMRNLGRTAVESARETRATRAELVAAARLHRRRGRRLRDQALAARKRNLDLSWRLWSLKALPEPPSTIPLSWSLPLDGEATMNDAVASAEECAQACTRAVRSAQVARPPGLAAIAGACSLAADHGRAAHPEAAAALGSCMRVIQSHAAGLDEARSTPIGVLAASAARRCSLACERALAVLYPVEQD